MEMLIGLVGTAGILGLLCLLDFLDAKLDRWPCDCHLLPKERPTEQEGR